MKRYLKRRDKDGRTLFRFGLSTTEPLETEVLSMDLLKIAFPSILVVTLLGAWYLRTQRHHARRRILALLHSGAHGEAVLLEESVRFAPSWAVTTTLQEMVLDGLVREEVEHIHIGASGEHTIYFITDKGEKLYRKLRPQPKNEDQRIILAALAKSVECFDQELLQSVQGFVNEADFPDNLDALWHSGLIRMGIASHETSYSSAREPGYLLSVTRHGREYLDDEAVPVSIAS